MLAGSDLAPIAMGGIRTEADIADLIGTMTTDHTVALMKNLTGAIAQGPSDARESVRRGMASGRRLEETESQSVKIETVAGEKTDIEIPTSQTVGPDDAEMENRAGHPNLAEGATRNPARAAVIVSHHAALAILRELRAIPSVGCLAPWRRPLDQDRAPGLSTWTSSATPTMTIRSEIPSCTSSSFGKRRSRRRFEMVGESAHRPSLRSDSAATLCCRKWTQ